MSGTSRVTPAVSVPSTDVQVREAAGGKAKWHGELDGAFEVIDSRLSHPRRRATDHEIEQPTLPGIAEVTLTSETLDEIAWRVAELLRSRGSLEDQPDMAAPLPPPPLPAAPEPLRPGIAVTIRLRRPLFSWWPFQRRRRRMMMTSFTDYRVT